MLLTEQAKRTEVMLSITSTGKKEKKRKKRKSSEIQSKNMQSKYIHTRDREGKRSAKAPETFKNM